MTRKRRHAPGGYVYHVLNRAVARVRLFQKEGDYFAFEQILEEAHQRVQLRILSYCLMPNHWHFVLWPEVDGQLTEFVRWLTHTHAMRWHAHYEMSGSGHLYQGRFKSFPVAQDDYFYTVIRYVERNALRAGLVERAEAWRWSSLWRLQSGSVATRRLLSPWPLPRPTDWIEHVNRPQTDAELIALRVATQRCRPLGNSRWQQDVARQLGLESSLRSPGRPLKQ
jgi:putative transposase